MRIGNGNEEDQGVVEENRGGAALEIRSNKERRKTGGADGENKGCSAVNKQKMEGNGKPEPSGREGRQEEEEEISHSR